MKLLFILISFIVNFILYCLPAILIHYLFKHWRKTNVIYPELENKTGLTLAVLPFIIWFILFLFDPTQKTVQQLIFLDPMLIGCLIAILLMIQQHILNRELKQKTNIAFIAIACLVAIAGFFIVNTSV